jgi:hypothetical protein
MNSGQFVWTVDGIVTCLQVGAVLIVSLLLGLVVGACKIIGWLERINDESEGDWRER